jgi:DNA-binding PadR family transcriptional regulator
MNDDPGGERVGGEPAKRTVGVPNLSRGDFGLLILGLISKREMYGYEIVAELRATTQGAIDLPEGTVYPALRRLERDGIVEGHWVEVGAGAPRRRYYRLTLRGEHALADGREEWRQFKAAADALLGPV